MIFQLNREFLIKFFRKIFELIRSIDPSINTHERLRNLHDFKKQCLDTKIGIKMVQQDVMVPKNQYGSTHKVI